MGCSPWGRTRLSNFTFTFHNTDALSNWFQGQSLAMKCSDGHITYKLLKSLQLCPTLCNAIDGSPPGSPVPGILQARTLEWVAISFSNHACMLSHFSCVRLCAILWTAAHQVPLSMGCCRQEYWSGLPFPSPRDLPNSGIKPVSLASPALTGEFFTTSATWETLIL